MFAYCAEIETAHADFGAAWEAFERRSTYRNAVAMCVLQIGELSSRLSDDFKARHAEIPWNQLRGMRNFVAHQYGSIDAEILWVTATEDISALRRFCEQLLSVWDIR